MAGEPDGTFELDGGEPLVPPADNIDALEPDLSLPLIDFTLEAREGALEGGRLASGEEALLEAGEGEVDA